jgi:hypothetical protein
VAAAFDQVTPQSSYHKQLVRLPHPSQQHVVVPRVVAVVQVFVAGLQHYEQHAAQHEHDVGDALAHLLLQGNTSSSSSSSTEGSAHVLTKQELAAVRLKELRRSAQLTEQCQLLFEGAAPCVSAAVSVHAFAASSPQLHCRTLKRTHPISVDSSTFTLLIATT